MVSRACRMPRATNKDGRGVSSTIKLYHDDNRERLQTHLMHVLAADSFAPLLKTFGGITPCEYSCRIWRSGTQRFIPHLIHQMPGLTTSGATRGIWPTHVSGIGSIAAKPPSFLRRRLDQPEQVKAN